MKTLSWVIVICSIRLLGAGSNPASAADYSNQGNSFYNAADYSKAESCFKKALEFEDLTHPENPMEAATILNNLAAVYRAQAAWAKAEPLYDQSVKILEDNVGPEHPSVSGPAHRTRSAAL